MREMICEDCRGKLEIESILTKNGVEIEIQYCPNCSILWEFNTSFEEDKSK